MHNRYSLRNELLFHNPIVSADAQPLFVKKRIIVAKSECLSSCTIVIC